MTRIVALQPAVEQVTELPTTTAVFDPAGRRVAWLKGGNPNSTEASQIVIRDLATGSDTPLETEGFLKTSLTWPADGEGVLFVGAIPGEPSRSDIFLAKPGFSPIRLTNDAGHKVNPLVDPTGAVLVYTVAATSPFGGRGAGPASSAVEAVVLDLKAGTSRSIPGTVPGSLSMSADGGTLA